MSRLVPQRPLRPPARRWQGILLLLLLGCLLGGCQSRPSAPLLRDGPVYRSEQEGFRFLVPEGWTQNASAVLPPGKLQGENFLVRYRVKSPEQGALLQVICCDESLSDDWLEHHTGPSYRIQHWKPAAEPETLRINGVPAQRYIYAASNDNRAMTKEVVCFQRNQRVYSFVGLFYSSDDKAREQIRRAVESMLWDA